MLPKINKKIRESILTFYYTNPSSNCYVRELSRRLDLDVSNLAKEMRSFVKEGIFNVEEKGKQKHYFLNKKSPIYEDLKNLVLKTEALGDILEGELAKSKKIRLAFIYGSFAKDEEHTESDIDLLVIGDIKTEELHKIIMKAESKLTREIHYIIYTSNEIKERIKKKDQFILNILHDKKIFLIGNKDDELFKLTQKKKNKKRKIFKKSNSKKN
ncbi:nucleotidyltransferase domain-containing protein [Patescibacteria group bacterium]|nr:nucleotidyltransferase domain-containing protein [Patescibacteria group bacterium]MCG2693615.1 nucleotidyltransferase domain-containing protein [Candidatus Parcubacteria bacterium]